ALELLWFVLIAVFALIGVVRGYPKELGATASILVGMLVLTEWGEDILNSLDLALGAAAGLSFLASPYAHFVQALFYIGFFVAMVFLAYHGETLAFRGYPPPGLPGVALNALNGAVNGYLVAGSVWYYLDRFDYPLRLFGLFSPPLTDLAQRLLPFLPVPILQPYLLLFIAFIFLMRVLR
ncbi:MAG: hypothetical protein HYZ68_02415, partial [Chloroflexi bacterium]|nr:hypothetical protein [Chloroflexota bacterium]